MGAHLCSITAVTSDCAPGAGVRGFLRLGRRTDGDGSANEMYVSLFVLGDAGLALGFSVSWTRRSVALVGYC